MADIIKMDYDLMEQMSQTFLQGVEQLQDTMQEMQSIANSLDEGALLGRGGDAFSDAIRSPLASALSKLTDKYGELSKDINTAMQAMQQADQSSEGMF